MNPEPWVRYGHSRGKFLERDAGPYGTVELYDIGDDLLVGAMYSDKSRQVQPLVWHGTAARRRMFEFREERARLLSSRPRLRISSRPRLREREQQQAAEPRKRSRMGLRNG